MPNIASDARRPPAPSSAMPLAKRTHETNWGDGTQRTNGTANTIAKMPQTNRSTTVRPRLRTSSTTKITAITYTTVAPSPGLPNAKYSRLVLTAWTPNRTKPTAATVAKSQCRRNAPEQSFAKRLTGSPASTGRGSPPLHRYRIPPSLPVPSALHHHALRQALPAATDSPTPRSHRLPTPCPLRMRGKLHSLAGTCGISRLRRQRRDRLRQLRASHGRQLSEGRAN